MQKDFPIFVVSKNEYFDICVNDAVDIKECIDEISEELEEIQKTLHDYGNKLNLYINNVSALEKPFNYKEHTIIIDDDNYAHVYDIQDVKDLFDDLDFDDIIEDFDDCEENIMFELPDSNCKFKLNNKQVERCFNLLDNFNVTYSEFEFLVSKSDSLYDIYNEIITEVKESLSENQILQICNKKTENFELEPYNKDTHELMITQDKKNNWQFIYIRKTDKDKVLNYLQ